jgi:GntR family transcriptional regulator, transcriptional repressor for pyruvate dehydrogenase complex
MSTAVNDEGNGRPDRAPLAIRARRRSPKTSEIVARELAAHIADSELPEGTALPTERVMAQSMGVGRTTVREALRLLETRGVLTIRSGPGGGPVVRRPRPRELAEALTLILQFEAATFEQVIEAREWLEPTIARKAVSKITAATISELEQANAAILDAVSDVDAFSAANREFHSVIAQNCGSIVLQTFSETLLVIADGRPMGITYSSRQITAIVAAHRAIIDTFTAGDEDAAEAAMSEHLREARIYWKHHFGSLIGRPVRWTQ